jgi:hypothetical protein
MARLPKEDLVLARKCKNCGQLENCTHKIYYNICFERQNNEIRKKNLNKKYNDIIYCKYDKAKIEK